MLWYSTIVVILSRRVIGQHKVVLYVWMVNTKHTYMHMHARTHACTRTHARTHARMHFVFVYIMTSLFHKVTQSKPSKVKNLPLNQISYIPISNMLPGVLGSAINAGNDWYTSSQCGKEQCNQSHYGTNKSTVSWLCWSCWRKLILFCIMTIHNVSV